MISIIIPVIREEKALRCIKLIRENAGIENYEIVTDTDTDRIGCPKMVKKLVSQCKGDMICFLGDDTLPQPNFLREASRVMHFFKDNWGLVGLNDLTGRQLPTHWLGHTRLLEHLDGEFFHTGYKHCYCDNELWDRCKDMNRYLWAEGAVVKHDHPIFTHEEPDADYIRVYSSEYMNHDRELYLRRKDARQGNV